MKITYKNLDKIFENCTGKEIDFLLEVVQYQDNKGVVKGIKYTDIMQNINISSSTFFSIIENLQKKDIINVNYNSEHYSYWEICIIDNSFEGKEDYQKGYLNINRTFLHSDAFRKLKRAEKVIVLNLFKIFNNRHQIPITIHTLKKWTNNKTQSIKKYIKNLCKFFDIKINNKLVVFIPNSIFVRKPDSEKTIKNNHYVNFITKVNKVKASNTQVKEVVKLFNQYPKISDKIIYDIIDKSLNQIQNLEVKYIHAFLRNVLKK